MAHPIVLRVDVAPAIGFGHLRRATALAAAAREAGREAVFAGPRESWPILVGDGIDPRLLVEPVQVPSVAGTGGAVVVDTFWSGNAAAAAAEVGRLAGAGLRVAVIDSLPPDHYVASPGRHGAALVVTPYLGAERFRPAPAGRWLVGPRYGILDPAFAAVRERLGPDLPARMLFVCGGSDPEGLTAAFLERLNPRGRPVDVVIGPLFSAPLRSRVADLAARLDRVGLLRAPPNLAEAVAAAGFVAGRVGLLRYEAAALGRSGLYLHFGPAYRPYLEAFGRSGLAAIRFADDPGGLDAFLDEAAGIANAEAGAGPTPRNDRAYDLVDGEGARRVIDAILDRDA